MGTLSDIKLLELLLALLPGFLTAEIIAVLVARQDRTTFDRIIQALIYTFLTHVLWTLISGDQPALRGQSLLGLTLVAVVLGLALAFLINTGYLYSVLRWVGTPPMTQAASTPNAPGVWFDTFQEKQQHAILHLQDGRRIFGWPRRYPLRPDKGHILLERAEWLGRPASASRVPLVDLLIDVKDVRFVEFLPPKKPE